MVNESIIRVITRLLAFHIARSHNRALPVNSEMRKATIRTPAEEPLGLHFYEERPLVMGSCPTSCITCVGSGKAMGLPEAAKGEVTCVSEVRRVLTSSSRTSAGVWCRGSMEVNVVGSGLLSQHRHDKRVSEYKLVLMTGLSLKQRAYKETR